MLISYSSNLEDVLLTRVFHNLHDGRYIDVGSFRPTEESNTMALYSRGWHGVAVDPIYKFETEWARRWKMLRPRDTMLYDAVGAAPGQIEYFLCNFRGLSTCSQAVLTRHLGLSDTNKKGEGTMVGVTTLDEIIAKCLDGKVPELICIDVEGMEGDVLKGIDLAKNRPWLFVVEAYYSADLMPHYPDWEPLLTGKDYGCVWDDRVNRWYLAGERAAVVDGAFAFPPNVTDNYTTYTELKLQQRLEEYESSRATWLTRRG